MSSTEGYVSPVFTFAARRDSRFVFTMTGPYWVSPIENANITHPSPPQHPPSAGCPHSGTVVIDNNSITIVKTPSTCRLLKVTNRRKGVAPRCGADITGEIRL